MKNFDKNFIFLNKIEFSSSKVGQKIFNFLLKSNFLEKYDVKIFII